MGTDLAAVTGVRLVSRRATGRLCSAGVVAGSGDGGTAPRPIGGLSGRHPPDSVGVVERILDDFRSGRQSVAEFWINLHGRFVHIRYFAVRDPKGEYLGTLEVTQDLTPLRALTGERRLLQYDTPGA